MENEIVKVEQKQEIAISEKEIISYLDLFGYSDIPEPEKKKFIKVCQLNGLNPFKREAHLSIYGKGDKKTVTIITGYMKYVKDAELSGRLAGWSSPLIEKCKTAKVDQYGQLTFIDDIKATITIFRTDFEKPFVHSVKLSEYIQKSNEGYVTKFWRKPESQLSKVAISQGFRLAFPEVLGGMPYTKEEMPENETIDITHTEVKPDPVTPKEKEELTVIHENWSKCVDYLAKNGTKQDNLSKLRGKYLISEQIEKLLIDEAINNVHPLEGEQENIH